MPFSIAGCGELGIKFQNKSDEGFLLVYIYMYIIHISI